MSTETDDLVNRYLKDLDRELRGLPRARRRDLVEEVRGHIADARSSVPGDSSAEVRTILDRIGDPGEIATEARDRFGVLSPHRGWCEVGALVLLALGFTLVGWLAGVALLWSSQAWTSREKLIGTLGWPVVFLLGAVVTVSVAASPIGSGPDGGLGPAELVTLAAVFVLPLIGVIYLAIKLHGRATTSAPAIGGTA